MALISSEPQTIGDMAARVAALEDKYVVAPNGTIPYENADPTPPG